MTSLLGHDESAGVEGMAPAPSDLYLSLLKRVLTRTLFDEELVAPAPRTRVRKAVLATVRTVLDAAGLELVRRVRIDRAGREEGTETYPEHSETMVGVRRLENIQDAVRTVLSEQIPGDWLETGVWRGGASIFARACFKAYGDVSRTVWLADSFAGLPKPSLQQDQGDMLWSYSKLAVGVDVVRENFRRYDLLDDRVRFLVGWFAETLPTAPIEQIAILRLDGDLYESTIDALTVYSKVSPGGFIIVDDYEAVPACKQAIIDFRRANGVEAPLVQIDQHAVYWRK
jgi:O-methyltransferase